MLDILGVEPEVITGDQEAEFSFTGATAELTGRTDLERPFLVVDIGGGSTEFVVGSEHVEAARSVDVGCVRMTERHLVVDGVVSDPPTGAQVAAIRADVEAALDLASQTVPLGRARTLVGLAGSVTTVAAIALGLPEYDSSAIHHARIPYEKVREVTERMLTSTHAEREALAVIHPGRVDVIGAGALVLLAIMDRVGASEVVVSEHDILDGIAFAAAGAGRRRSALPDPSARAAAAVRDLSRPGPGVVRAWSGCRSDLVAACSGAGRAFECTSFVKFFTRKRGPQGDAEGPKGRSRALRALFVRAFVRLPEAGRAGR